MQQNRAIELRGVSVTYGRGSRAVTALTEVNLDIAPGESVALVGANGAGKSTLTHVLLGILPPTTGTVRVTGTSPRQALANGAVGAMLQDTGLMRQITVGELIQLVCHLYGRGAASPPQLLAEVGLADLVRRRATRLSGGQRQRLKLALALAGQPRLLMLDEPTAALDPQARQAFWVSLRQRMADGATVLFTTHLLEEAQQFADRIVVIRSGAVIADGSADSLVSRGRTSVVGFRADAIEPTALTARLDQIRAEPAVREVRVEDGRIVLETSDVDATLAAVYASGLRPRDVQIVRPSLTDAVLDLIREET